jgi:predicted transcriptional regulator
LGCVDEYAEATGRTRTDCLEQAIDDWIRVVAKTISQDEKFNVLALLPLEMVN